MRQRTLCPALLTGLVLLFPAFQKSVGAEVMATGTRLSINGGAPRAFMTYGYPEEPAFYAPVVGELVKLGVSFRAHKLQANESEVVVSYQGKQIAVWPV